MFRFSEGLPGLLAQLVEGLELGGFADLASIDTDANFNQILRNYVERRILSAEGLSTTDAVASRAEREVLLLALRTLLLPNRIFLESQLRYHNNDELHEAMDNAGWDPPELWRRLRQTALFVRPQFEPFDALDPTVRRLLGRYFFTTPSTAMAAHLRAAEFYKRISLSLSGPELALITVEQLWHEVARLQLEDGSNAKEALLTYTEDLARTLSRPISDTEGRTNLYIAKRLSRDDEFEQATGNFPGLFGDVVEIFSRPAPAS
jgi:hypothetical protein